MSEFKPDEKMLQDYIQNKLSAENTEAVELWLAEHPQVLQDMQLDMMFTQGLEDMQATDESDAHQVFHLPDSTFFNRFALAFLLVLAFFLGGLTVHYFDEDTGLSMTSPDTVMLSTTRSSQTAVQLHHHQNTVLQIPVGYLSDDPHTVELSDTSKTIYRLDHVTAKDDLLTVFIPQDLLAPGSYQLAVTNLNTWERETFGLAVQ